MEKDGMLFFMESGQKPELAPEKAIADAEANLYQSSENDDGAYTRNTTTWD